MHQIELTEWEVKLLLELVCDRTQRTVNLGGSPSKEIYELRYKLSDLK